ncbi:MAG: aldo/keto reductase [Defluviitaleaceae bacterium]|nr:aldo/keto reductase [Defluviitaleaceae bacterium]MCL2274521.1 aldo/keto reductase [Defluviitaleaceae bacterium]
MKLTHIHNKRLGVSLSQLGFGAMRLPTLENGKVDRSLAGKMIDTAYAAGVNYFDTAHPYHGGESQVFLGEALRKYPRDSYYFANKLPTWAVDSKEKVKELFDAQLAACGLEYFDFYMIHGLGEDRYAAVDKFEIYTQLLAEKQAGRIKFLGFSYHGNLDAFTRLFENYKWDFAMIQYNYVDNVMLGTQAYYDIMEKHNTPCMVMAPIRGKFLATPPKAAAAEMTKPDGGKTTPAAWALRWCMDKPNIAVTLSGMSTMQQVEENIATFALSPPKLSAEESAMLERARDIMLAIKTVSCTYCGYCMDCPTGVDIPRLFEVYNQYKLFPNEFRAGVGYGKLVRDGKGFEGRCTACNICSPQCPQNIDISNELAKLHEELEPLRQRFIASV